MFASDLDAASRAQLTRGARLMELLKQGQASPFPVEDQVVSIWAGTTGQLDSVRSRTSRRFEAEFLDYLRREKKGLLRRHPRDQEVRGRDPLRRSRTPSRRSRSSSQASGAENTPVGHEADPEATSSTRSSRRRSSSRSAESYAGCAPARAPGTVQRACRCTGIPRLTSGHGHQERTREAATYGSPDAGLPPADPVRPGDKKFKAHGADRRLAHRQGAAAGRSESCRTRTRSPAPFRLWRRSPTSTTR